MTVLTNSGFENAASADAYGELALVEMQFQGGTLRLTSWPLSVDVMGETWTGVGALGSIGKLHESEDGAAEKLTLTLDITDFGIRTLALGSPGSYQDRTMKMWFALLDATTLQISGQPVLRFVGVMDQIKMTRDQTSAAIHLDCRSNSFDVRSNPSSLRCNDAQHQARHPGERGFEYLNSLIGTPSVWLSKAFQASLIK